MNTSDAQEKGSRRETQGNQAAGESVADISARSSDANHPDAGDKEIYAEDFARYWERVYERLPSAQTVTNWLLAIFTGLLAFLAFVTEQPLVTVRATPLQNFFKGGTPREMIVFDNIGHQPAKSFKCGMFIETLNYPLGGTHLTETLPNSLPFDLYPTNPSGIPAIYPGPINDADYDAVHESKGKVIYVWGTVEYKGFFHISHSENFCFAFGGSGVAPGVCLVERPRRSYKLENDQEPNAQPVPEIPLARPSAR